MSSHNTTPASALYDQLGIELRHTGSGEAAARCFATPDLHQAGDRTPSTSVNLTSGAWICHACGSRGGAYDAALSQGHTPRSAMALLIACGLAQPRNPNRQPQPTPVGKPAPPPPRQRERVTQAQIDHWHHRLQSSPQLQRRLLIERAITRATIEVFALGYDRGRITIPTTGPAGTLTGLLRWAPFDRSGPKMLAAAGTRRDLFPAPETLGSKRLLICEGEPDALAAHSASIPAVAIPGVASWRPEWATRFTGRTITIALDADLPGRRCAQHIAADLHAAGIEAAVVDLAPSRNDGYDLTDHLLAGSRGPVLS